jgi:hypothetical protein
MLHTKLVRHCRKKVSQVFEHPVMWTDEGVEVKLQTFFSTRHHIQVSAQLHEPPTCPGKTPLIPTGWAPNLFYTLRKLEKTLPVSGIEIRIPRSSSACSSHYSVSHHGSQTMQYKNKIKKTERYSFCLMVEASDHGYVLHTRRIHVTRYRI